VWFEQPVLSARLVTHPVPKTWVAHALRAARVAPAGPSHLQSLCLHCLRNHPNCSPLTNKKRPLVISSISWVAQCLEAQPDPKGTHTLRALSHLACLCHKCQKIPAAIMEAILANILKTLPQGLSARRIGSTNSNFPSHPCGELQINTGLGLLINIGRRI
jgi:hypothetical protein